MILLFLVTLAFVLYKKKALLMLRALFSTRYLQQLFREGKFSNERIYLYPVLLFALSFPSLLLVFFLFYAPPSFMAFSPLLIYFLAFGGIVAIMLLSHLCLRFFTTIFNYQEQRYLHSTIKAIYRFYNALFLIILVTVIWYARLPQLIFFAYFPLLLMIFLAYLILFLRNINVASRIHFFIYFCTLEILPYLLLVKLLVINI